MPNPTQLTLKTIRSSNIGSLLNALYFTDLTKKQMLATLKISLLFLNSEIDHIREMGYRILLKYSNKTGDFIPLFDVAAGSGFIPIMKLLRRQSLIPDSSSFINIITDSFEENFKLNDTYQTEDQNQLFYKFSELYKESLAVIAPTSYGKSELIEKMVLEHENLNIAIVVPSKALISQTRRRVIQNLPAIRRKQVLVHHDMAFDLSQPIVAVVTQERLLRLFHKYQNLKFNVLFVDEAHNLLSADKRSRLLASAIIIAKIRNFSVAIKYLTPFLVDSDSLQLITDNIKIKQLKIQEKLKTEDYYVVNTHTDGNLKLYDQFMDRFYVSEGLRYKNEIQILQDKKSSKNIVYLNKPKSIEFFAEKLANSNSPEATPELTKICDEISEYVHPQYRILDCLRRGVAYHHGSVPDIVRAYIENSFRMHSAVKWIITNSTLLEGVNIPAEVLFILDPTKGQGNLSIPQFRNLVGRVNRFSEIFDSENGSPKLLAPAVYLVNCGFSRKKANFENYIKKVAKIDKIIDDEIKNPLLNKTEENSTTISQKDEDLTYIENLEKNSNLRDGAKIATTEIGRLCYAHNIFEIDILAKENNLELALKSYDNDLKISDANGVMSLINDVFISQMSEQQRKDYVNLARLQNPAARQFYAMFFDWRINQINYRRMIGNFIKYWKKVIEDKDDTVVFVGRWGNIPRDGYAENYVDLTTMTDYDLINLAIVRIKEEQDFIDNSLVKFFEVANDLGLLDTDLYNKIKYGTTDPTQIALIRSGFSHISANVLVKKYSRFISVEIRGAVKFDSQIINEFDRRGEKDLLIFEVTSSGLLEN